MAFIATISPAWATLIPQNVQFTSAFTHESHPSDLNTIRAVGNELNYIRNGSWIRFQNINFGTGISYLYVEAANGSTSGREICPHCARIESWECLTGPPATGLFPM